MTVREVNKLIKAGKVLCSDYIDGAKQLDPAARVSRHKNKDYFVLTTPSGWSKNVHRHHLLVAVEVDDTYKMTTYKRLEA